MATFIINNICMFNQLNINQRLALPSTLSDREKTNAVSDSDCAVLKESFKDEYFQPAYVWFLMQKPSHRTKVIALLNGKLTEKDITTRNLNSSRRTRDPNSKFILRTPLSVINFNSIINNSESQTYNKMSLNPQRMRQTAIQREGLFGYAESNTKHNNKSLGLRPRGLTPTLERKECSSYAQYLVKSFFTPTAAQRILPIADEKMDLLKEIALALEKRSTYYPIDPLKTHPSMNVKTMGRTTKTLHELDHIRQPSQPHYDMASNDDDVRRNVRSRNVAKEKNVSVTQSCYTEMCTQFLDEKYNINKTKMIRPDFHPSPFTCFPEVKPVAPPPSLLLSSQFNTNKQDGRANKRIYSGTTCL